MPSRKYQPKRKHGCKTCKRRKVRCTLEKPICNNCKRLERHCVYEATQKPLGTPSGPQTPAVLQTTDILMLRLMHHYTASTCYHISDNPEFLEIWQRKVPQIAFEHPFVLHGILAVAALHMHHDAVPNSPPDLVNVASDYQQKALTDYIPLLSSITQENCHALFAFSFLICNIGYALLDRKFEPDSEDAGDAFIDSLLGVFELLKGATTVAVQARDWLRAGELASLLDDRHPLLDRNQGPESVSLIDELRDLLSEVEREQNDGMYPADAMTLADCRSSVEMVNFLFASELPRSSRIAAVIGFPALLRDDYLSLLRQRDEAALILLGYYAMTLSALDDVWWLRDLGNKTFDSAAALVRDEQLHFMRTTRGILLGFPSPLSRL